MTNPAGSAIQQALQGFSQTFFPIAQQQLQLQQEMTMREALSQNEFKQARQLQEEKLERVSLAAALQRKFEFEEAERERALKRELAEETTKRQLAIFGGKEETKDEAKGQFAIKDFTSALEDFNESSLDIVNIRQNPRSLKIEDRMALQRDPEGFMSIRGLGLNQRRQKLIGIFKGLPPKAKASALELITDQNLRTEFQSILQAELEAANQIPQSVGDKEGEKQKKGFGTDVNERFKKLIQGE